MKEEGSSLRVRWPSRGSWAFEMLSTLQRSRPWEELRLCPVLWDTNALLGFTKLFILFPADLFRAFIC